MTTVEVVEVPAVDAAPAVVFEFVYRMYRRWVVSRFYERVGEVQLAEDLTQELFLGLWRDMEAGKQVYALDRLWPVLRMRIGWTCGRYFDSSRERRGVREVPTEAVADRPAESRTEQVVCDRLEVVRLLSPLSARQRRVMLLRLAHGLSFGEIALECGLPCQTARNELTCAVAALRAQLGVKTQVRHDRFGESRARAVEAREVYQASVAAGKPLTLTALGAQFGMSRKWARCAVQDTGATEVKASQNVMVAEQLRADISCGRLAPGAALPVLKELMARFDVSSATIREALAEMTARGELLHATNGPYYVPGDSAPALARDRKQVTEELSALLRSGRLTAGTLLPRVIELATRFQVHKSTMQLIMADLRAAHLVEPAANRRYAVAA